SAGATSRSCAVASASDLRPESRLLGARFAGILRYGDERAHSFEPCSVFRAARTRAFASRSFVYSPHAAFSAWVAVHIVRWQVSAPAGIVESKRTSKPRAPAISLAASIMPWTK